MAKTELILEHQATGESRTLREEFDDAQIDDWLDVMRDIAEADAAAGYRTTFS